MASVSNPISCSFLEQPEKKKKQASLHIIEDSIKIKILIYNYIKINITFIPDINTNLGIRL